MVVDDHLDTARVLALLLSQEGVPTKYFPSGADAIAAIQELKPSVVILAQMISNSLAIEVLQGIRAIPAIADIPVIIYSATETGMQEAKRLGAIPWPTKYTIKWTELRDCVLAVYKDSLKSSP